MSENPSRIMSLLEDIIEEAGDAKKKQQWLTKELEIKRKGSEIVLPKGMDVETAIAWLHQYNERQEQTYQVQEVFRGMYATEAAVAFYRAMQDLYGASVQTQTRQVFIFEVPPQMVSIQTGPTETIEFPVGQFQVPTMKSPIQTGLNRAGQFQVTGDIKGKERDEFYRLMHHARTKARLESIYKGRAIRFGNAEVGGWVGPDFIDLSHVNREKLILNEDVEAQVNQSILTPISHAERCRNEGIPLDRKVLLSGQYGTGKTMTSRLAALKAIEHGWTFIEVSDQSNLRSALEFARRYQPAVVFCEDIDRVVDERDDEANALINEVDGFLSKGNEILVVMTTNHVENITPAMLRPGRLDAIIKVDLPDANSRYRLIKAYGGARLGDVTKEDLQEAVDALAGAMPSTIREVVERAKLGMVGAERDHLTPSDILTSALSMQYHQKLLNGPVKELSEDEKFGNAFRQLLSNGALEPIRSHLQDIKNDTNDIIRSM